MKTPPEQPPKRPGLAAAVPAGWPETQPACWRSEAFAEDIYDSLAPARDAGTASKPPALLRRALAVVLRR